MRTAVLLALAVAVAVAISDEELQFRDFIKKYEKTYNGAQYEHRLQVFKDNLVRAAEWQKKMPTAQFGVTQFMDLTPEEFTKFYKIANFTEKVKDLGRPVLPRQNLNATLPGGFDWRNEGVVTGVYNQGQCGSCWAFSTAENIESMWARAGRGLTNLAMQQLVDCDRNDDGCGGGLPARAYAYIMSAGGIDSYNSYPYVGYNEPCRFNPGNVAARISSWGYITQSDNENYMQQWTYANGPPSICVDATSWQYYGGGVIGASCGTAIDHCVQLTGWTSVSGYNVWTVRNSWGTGWGYGGYCYVQMGINACAIGEFVSSSVI
jgi:C1A family cysteine protease